jgi:Arc/MetJ-type ribon-helix-helix transcriptional regulator
MKIELTPPQAFVRDAVASGRLRDEADAIREALALWERRERARTEILANLAAAEAALARGAGRAITEDSVCRLATEVKQRGRAPRDHRRPKT